MTVTFEDVAIVILGLGQLALAWDLRQLRKRVETLEWKSRYAGGSRE